MITGEQLTQCVITIIVGPTMPSVESPGGKGKISFLICETYHMLNISYISCTVKGVISFVIVASHLYPLKVDIFADWLLNISCKNLLSHLHLHCYLSQLFFFYILPKFQTHQMLSWFWASPSQLSRSMREAMHILTASKFNIFYILNILKLFECFEYHNY